TPGSSPALAQSPEHHVGQHRSGVDAAAGQQSTESAEADHREDVEASVRILDQVHAREDETEVPCGRDCHGRRLRFEVRLLVAAAGEDRGHPLVVASDAPVRSDTHAVENRHAEVTPRMLQDALQIVSDAPAVTVCIALSTVQHGWYEHTVDT